MQFSIVAIVAALAATTTANYVAAPANGTTPYPTGTGSVKPSGSTAPTKSQLPFTGAASVPTHMAGSALGLVVAGGVAMML
ncbi:uncharacterized protein K460DRAFT_366817 [Cucurbitaria berberidis CBS 394.84]|uniref:Uncharacterized protein n=1 Tax=Cucurbitaria berberidis CBS 394.84 TaxID=1168544 RepID=A0A9P4GI99_9PLEO|nr:uncharacterized protein K460DRAFT_366817 [Cucurbitaria berberidis CBS 394.84]KAF1845969.1 hypothetical protein K460DRAFT_366817 [Cucurbitaria berberidis CBS 394.84]